jgi:hypothetical protein
MRKWLSVVIVAVFLADLQPGASLQMSAAGLPSQPVVGAGEIDVSSSARLSAPLNGGNSVAKDSGGIH